MEVLVNAYLLLQAALFLIQSILSLKNNMNWKEEKRLIYLRLSLGITFIIGAIMLMVKMPGEYSRLITAGVIFSVIGDIIMSQALNIKNRLVFGMASFAVTHFLYIAAFNRLLWSQGNSLCHVLPYTAVPYLIITSVLSLWLVRRKEYGKLINNAAFMYGIIASLMAAFGGAAAISMGGIWSLLGYAAGLFLFSDIIMALTELGKHNIPKAGCLIWAAYSAAQIGIIASGLL